MPERARTLRSISGCQIASVNIDCSRGKNTKFISTAIYWMLPMCRAQSAGPGMEGWINRVNQTAEALLRRQLVNRTSRWNVMLHSYPFEPALRGTSFPPTPDVPEMGLETPHSGNYWFYFQQYCAFREVWESIFSGNVCSVIYHFCHLS